MVIGERGLILLSALAEFSVPIYGPVTGAAYPFHIKKRMYVDRRDAVMLLGPEFDIG